MTKELTKRIRVIFGIVLSVSIVIAGLCLIYACVSIYQTGDQPFSREAVADAFSGIAIPVYLCLGLVIIGFLVELVLPTEKEKRIPGRQTALILQRLHSKTDLDQCDEALRSAVAAEQKSRKLHRTITAGLLAVGSVIFLIYALNGSNFHQSQINDSMIRAMRLLLPCMAVPFGYGVFTVYHNAASMEKEIALLKQADSKKEAAPLSLAPAPNRRNVVRNVVLVVAIVILIYGFFTGGTADVLTKAVNICTECVGLG